MKVILNDYVEKLGERGEVVEVKPGFARNFLFPKGLAYVDTPGNRKQFEQEQRRWQQMELNRKSAADAAAEQLQGTELVFERRAGETGTLFGSVTSTDIADALNDKGYEVNRRRVMIDEPLKELGSNEITVKLHRDVAVTVTVHVTRPGMSVEDMQQEVAAQAPAAPAERPAPEPPAAAPAEAAEPEASAAE